MTSDDGWEEYKATFNKIYKDEKEEQMRHELYSEAKQRVDEHNKLNGHKQWRYLGKHSDYTPEELSKVGYKPNGNGCPGYYRPRVFRDPELPEAPEFY